MNYQIIYDQIIDRAKNRKKPDCYCELHHIIPKSLGGSNDKENLVYLTAREHFIAHWLLKNIHKNKQMIYAFFSMTKPVGNGRTRYTSHSFKYAREAFGRWMSENRRGENNHFFGLPKELNPHYGMKRSAKTKALLSEKAKQRTGEKNGKSKPIYCIETGEVFPCASAAKNKYKKGNIAYALKTGGKCGGLTFAYVGEEPKRFNYSWASGERSYRSRKVKDEFGNLFVTIGEAGQSIGASGTAISIAIKQKRKCKCVWFEYV